MNTYSHRFHDKLYLRKRSICKFIQIKDGHSFVSPKMDSARQNGHFYFLTLYLNHSRTTLWYPENNSFAIFDNFVSTTLLGYQTGTVLIKTVWATLCSIKSQPCGLGLKLVHAAKELVNSLMPPYSTSAFRLVITCHNQITWSTTKFAVDL